MCTTAGRTHIAKQKYVRIERRKDERLKGKQQVPVVDYYGTPSELERGYSGKRLRKTNAQKLQAFGNKTAKVHAQKKPGKADFDVQSSL